ncbi:conserved hypothetical protein, partial [delta proteobacterium NaphS2]
GSEMPFLRLMGCYCERFSPPRLRQSSTNCSGGVHMMVKKPLFQNEYAKSPAVLPLLNIAFCERVFGRA